MKTTDPRRISDLGVIEFLNTFSIPVVIGSLATSFFFGRFFRSDIPLVFYWLLPTTVWFIYTLDHLLDGIRLGQEASSLRHRIHYQYRKPLQFILFVLGVLNSFLVIFLLPWYFTKFGLLLSGFVVIYFFVVHRMHPISSSRFKEVAIAIGVWLGMLVLPGLPKSLELNVANVALHLTFIGLNLSNLLIFSYFDFESDSNDGLIYRSSGENAKERLSGQINYTLATTFILIGFWAFLVSSSGKLPVIMAFMLMLNVLMILMLRKDLFVKDELYRLLGDMIYVLPGLIWFILRDKPVF